MASDDCRSFVERMRGYGLVYLRDGWAMDLVVMDQQSGPLMPCDWAEFGFVTLNLSAHTPVACARLIGSNLNTLVTPDDWSFDESLTKSFGFLPDDQASRTLELLEDKDGLEVYLNHRTGKKVYVGRQRP